MNVSEFNLYHHFSEAKIEELAQIERSNIQKDLSILQYYENKNKFESNIYGLKEKIATSARNADLKDFLNPNTYNELIEYFNQLESQFESISNYETVLKEANAKIAYLHQETLEAKRKYSEIEKELKKF